MIEELRILRIEGFSQIDTGVKARSEWKEEVYPVTGGLSVVLKKVMFLMLI